MKREAPSKAKFLLLVERLKGNRLLAFGALEALWHFTAANRPRGDIGNGFSETAIERLIGWRGRRGELIAALIDTCWIDLTSEGLVVHDWSEHCDDQVHASLA